jgi:hypothetical protein
VRSRSRFGGREYGVVAAVDLVLHVVTLEHALHRSYAAGAVVRGVTTGAGAATTTTRSVDAGDGLLLLGAPLTGTAVAIGGAPVEYHDLGAISDANGFWAVDGVGGVRGVTFRAAAAPFADLDVPLTLDYGNAVNPLGFRLKP